MQILEVVDFEGMTRWRWRLWSDDGQQLPIEQQVDLDGKQWQLSAFYDLRTFLRWNAAPDRLIEDQIELVDQVGRWVGDTILGPVGAALALPDSAVVLRLPLDARPLGYLPWELAVIDGHSLAARKVSFVVGSTDSSSKRQDGRTVEQIRMLAIFSMPEGLSALNLRRERLAMTRLIDRIRDVYGTVVEFQTVQYGVTRARLHAVLNESQGWDIVHIAGHGLPAALVMENDSGEQDVVSGEELVELLEVTQQRLKLVTLSTCESAAKATKSQLRALGLRAESEIGISSGSDSTELLPAVATRLVDELGCAVVAMRFPITDEFSIALSTSLYQGLLGEGKALPRALTDALSQAIPMRPTTSFPPLSIVTPALFGDQASERRFVSNLSTREDRNDRTQSRLLPPQREHYVGRTGVMSRTTSALTRRAPVKAVILNGAAGVGKSATAIELAHTLAADFDLLIWHEVTDRADLSASIGRFAAELELQLPHIDIVHLLANGTDLERCSYVLREVLHNNNILVVLDNAESLLTSSGSWRDPRWRAVFHALTEHGGKSRFVMTTRRRPASTSRNVLIEYLHPLSTTEAFLLAREQPHLKALLTAAETGDEGARTLLLHTLALAQGHPKLLEFADSQATDRKFLARKLDQANRTISFASTRPDAQARDSEFDDADNYERVIETWTRDILLSMHSDDNLIFGLLCCLEVSDRTLGMLAVVSNQVRRHLGLSLQTSIPLVLLRLEESPLLRIERAKSPSDHRYHIHPSVANAGRQLAGAEIAAAVDIITSNIRIAQVKELLQGEQHSAHDTSVLRVCQSMMPYLFRRREWADLLRAAQSILQRDSSSRTTSTLRPILAQVVAVTRGTDLELDAMKGYAATIRAERPEEAASMLVKVSDVAAARGHHRDAAAVTQDVVNIYRDLGRIEEATAHWEKQAQYNALAGRERLDQIAVEGQGLQLLQAKGEHELVSHGINLLLDELATMRSAGDVRAGDAWTVTEPLLDIARISAVEEHDWGRALAVNAEILTSKSSRRAPEIEWFRSAFNNYGPLLRTGRTEEARDLLIRCRAVFTRLRSNEEIGKVMSALANVEFAAGHIDRSVQLEKDALRFKYKTGEPESIKISHSQLSDYFQRSGAPPRTVLAHATCAALVSVLGGYGSAVSRVSHLVRAMVQSRATALPFGYAALCEIVNEVPGVQFDQLCQRLAGTHEHGDVTLDSLVELMKSVPEAEVFDFAQHDADWTPVLSAMLSSTPLGAFDTDSAAADIALDLVLGQRSRQDDWRDLVPILQMIRKGERSAKLADGLHPVHRHIVRRALDAHSGVAEVDRKLWRDLVERPEQLNDMAEFKALIVAAGLSAGEARDELEGLIDGLLGHADGAALGGVLRSIIAGTRNLAVTDVLGEPHRSIVRGAIERIIAIEDSQI